MVRSEVPAGRVGVAPLLFQGVNVGGDLIERGGALGRIIDGVGGFHAGVDGRNVGSELVVQAGIGLGRRRDRGLRSGQSGVALSRGGVGGSGLGETVGNAVEVFRSGDGFAAGVDEGGVSALPLCAELVGAFGEFR